MTFRFYQPDVSSDPESIAAVITDSDLRSPSVMNRMPGHRSGKALFKGNIGNHSMRNFKEEEKLLKNNSKGKRKWISQKP
ncbi:MAG: hypothetical protein DRI57_07930 [Deltaproteobacteria bacterium]|nr:MAG: hypothetical protein DRI57_07930 [Deltaproteobacteria bacterium]